MWSIIQNNAWENSLKQKMYWLKTQNSKFSIDLTFVKRVFKFRIAELLFTSSSNRKQIYISHTGEQTMTNLRRCDSSYLTVQHLVVIRRARGPGGWKDGNIRLNRFRMSLGIVEFYVFDSFDVTKVRWNFMSLTVLKS